MKIVIVDDNPINLLVVGQVCSQLPGAEHVNFDDSELAIQHLMQNPADLIVVDYSMPRVTGVELIKRMRTSLRHEKTPIIMLTSSSEGAVHRRAIEVGATQFITKPIRPSDLLARFKEIAGDRARDGRRAVAC